MREENKKVERGVYVMVITYFILLTFLFFYFINNSSTFLSLFVLFLPTEVEGTRDMPVKFDIVSFILVLFISFYFDFSSVPCLAWMHYSQFKNYKVKHLLLYLLHW
jgi:hypothetical protein